MIALVLVVDDDPLIRSLLRDYLEGKNCRVLEAGDGSKGFTLAEQHRPHLIVMDVMMPSLYGTASSRRIRDAPGLAQIPIILHTGVPEAKVRAILPLDEKMRFLPKPTDLNLLWQMVGELLPQGGFTR